MLLEQEAIPRVVPKLNRQPRSPNRTPRSRSKDDSDMTADRTTTTLLPEVQSMLRSKLGKIQSGLRKRRVVSVVEDTQPDKNATAFYVPTPLVMDNGPASLPPYYLHSQTHYHNNQNQFESSFVSNNIHKTTENVPKHSNNISRASSQRFDRRYVHSQDLSTSNWNHSDPNVRTDHVQFRLGTKLQNDPFIQRSDESMQHSSLRISPPKHDPNLSDVQRQYDHGYHSIESQYNNYNNTFKSATPEHNTSKIANLNQIKRLHNSSPHNRCSIENSKNLRHLDQHNTKPKNHDIYQTNDEINFRLGINIIESNGYGKYKVIEPSKHDRSRRWSQIDDLRIDELKISNNDQILHPIIQDQSPQSNTPVKFQIGGTVSNHVVHRKPALSPNVKSSIISPSSIKAAVEPIPEEDIKNRRRTTRSISPEFRRKTKKEINRSLCDRRKTTYQQRASCDLQTFVQRLDASRSLDKKVR